MTRRGLDLVAAHLSGRTSSAEEAELFRLLAEDGALAERLVQQARLEVDLETLFRPAAVPSWAPPPRSAPTAARTPRRRQTAAVLAMAAGVALAVGFGWLVRGRSPGPLAGRDDRVPAEHTATAPQQVPPRARSAALGVPAAPETLPGTHHRRSRVEAGGELAEATQAGHLGSPMFSMDFESRGAAKLLSNGHVTNSPPSTRGRLSAQADRFGRQSPWVTVLLQNHESHLFAYEPDLVLAFDYWLGEATTAPKLFINVIVGDQRAYFQVGVSNINTGHWHRVALPLASIPHHKGSPDVMTPGLPIVGIEVGTDWAKNDVLFVDNIEIFRQPR